MKRHLSTGKGIFVHDPQTEKTVVIVEDDEDIGLVLVQCIVHETPFRALLVTNASDALQAMRIHPTQSLSSGLSSPWDERH